MDPNTRKSAERSPVARSRPEQGSLARSSWPARILIPRAVSRGLAFGAVHFRDARCKASEQQPLFGQLAGSDA